MIKKVNTLILFIIIYIIIAGLISCTKKKETKEVSLKGDKEAIVREVTPDISRDDKPIRIAIGSMITPREGFVYYKQLLEYIEEELVRDVKLVDRENYAEVNALLESGNIDVAFVCGGPYVDGHDEFGLELLAVPMVDGKRVYYSYIIVPAESHVESLEDLRGKTFAFTDPGSNSGKLFPTYILSKMNETPDSFFEKFVFTYAHDKSIRAVAKQMVDGAAVDSLIWEYFNETKPQLTSNTKIIMKSHPYGIPPVVVTPGIKPEIKKQLKEILLNLHNDEKGKAILHGMKIDKFVTSDDSAYNSIRDMKAWIEKNQIK